MTKSVIDTVKDDVIHYLPQSYQMNIKARFGNGTNVDITLPDNGEFTVQNLKELIHSISGEQQDGMRLVYKGRIMQNEEQLVSDFKIQEGEVVHVAKGRTTSVSSTPPLLSPAINPEQEMISSMMEDPMFQYLLSNPDYLQSIIHADPRFRRMAEVYFVYTGTSRNSPSTERSWSFEADG
jgi:hypothetical protein